MAQILAAALFAELVKEFRGLLVHIGVVIVEVTSASIVKHCGRFVMNISMNMLLIKV